MHPTVKRDLNAHLNVLVRHIDEQTEVVEKRAAELNFAPTEMMYADGKYVLVPLLEAKAQALNALVTLNKE